MVKFELEGADTIVRVWNDNPKSLESYKLSERKAWNDRCLVIIKSNQESGEIKLKVTAVEMKNTEIKIKVSKF